MLRIVVLLVVFVAGILLGGVFVHSRRPAPLTRSMIEPADPAMIECLRDLEAAKSVTCPSLPDCWLPCPEDGGTR